MEAIYIPRLIRAPECTETCEVNNYLEGLDTLTPVQGEVRVTHHGNYLEVKGKAETIITLTCDRCLNHYNYRLAVQPSELIWLADQTEEEEEMPLERETTLEELVETLPPMGYFHPDKWLYEQLCLEIPQRKLCDRRCPGIQVSEPRSSTPLTSDRRWASLEALKDQYEL